MMRQVFSVQRYLEAGIMKDMYPLHAPHEATLLKEHWLSKRLWRMPPLGFATDLLLERPRAVFEQLSMLRRYFGEKEAFYYAWVSHYTVFLLFAVVWLCAPCFRGLCRCSASC